MANPGEMPRIRGEYSKGGIFELALGKRKNEAFAQPTGNIESVETSEQFLKAINFEELNAILHTLAKRSGIPHTRDITASDISFAEDLQGYAGASQEGHKPHVGGAADKMTHTIKLDWKGLKEMKEKFKLQSPLGLLALQSLFHESVHLYAFHDISGMEPGDPGKRISAQKGIRRIWGYQEQQFAVSGEMEMIETGVSFNEAVTEEIALQAFDEYLARVGERALSKKYPESSTEMSTLSYANDRFILNATIDALARELKTDRDIVWRGFVQGYMFGEESSHKLLIRIASELIAGSRNAAMAATDLHSGAPIAGSISELAQGMSQEEMESALERIVKGIRPDEIRDALGLR